MDKKSRGFVSGAAMALPIVVGYVAVGIPFGILGVKIGLPVWALVLMSFFAYAGSAQFVALGLIESGSGIVPILSATFILNLRHLFMSMSLGSALPRVRIPLLTYLAHSITDESYGVNIIKAVPDEKLDPMDIFGTNVVAHFVWVAATLFGAWIGKEVPIDVRAASAALPIMFAVLLAMQVKRLGHVLVVVMSASMTVFLIHMIEGSAAFLISAIAVPTVATLYRMIGKK